MIMKQFFAIVGILLCLGAANVWAVDSDLTFTDPIVRSPIPGMSNTAGYVTLTNNAKNTIRLVDAKSDLASRVEFHDHLMTDGVMKMVKVEKVNIAPKQSITFESGGLHIMFIDVKSGFQDIKTIPVTLIDEQGNEYVHHFSFQSVHSHHQHH
jgi:hypothetical protein